MKNRKLDESVLDCGLIRARKNARELQELVPRQLKKESEDPVENISCPYCFKKYTTAPSLTSHMVKHSASREDVSCPVCVFSTEYSKMVDHIRSMHSMEKVFFCAICDTEFSTLSAKSIRMRKHNRSESLGLDQCQNPNCKKFFKKILGKGCTSCSKR